MLRRPLVAAIAAIGALSATVLGASRAQEARAAAAFPVTVRADNGKVTIPARPRRIVSLSPTATEMLFAVGAGRQVVAVDDQSNFPRSAPRTRLSGFKPNAEAIARYRPDLVVISNDQDQILSKLRRLRVPVLLNGAAPNLGEAYRQMGQLGIATGHRAQAGRLIARLRARMAAIVASVRAQRGRRLSFYHELSPDLYSATSRTFIGSIYARLGLRNIADRAAAKGIDYPKLSSEAIVAADPDIIFLADVKCCGQSAATVAARPGWSGIAAVRRRAVVALDDDVASRWGPRIVDFAATVARRVAALRRAA